MRYSVFVLALLSVGSWAQKPAAVAPLPPGPGQKIVASSCTLCHTLARVEKQHQSRTGWEHTVAEMNKKGAGLTPAQVKTVVAYLAKNYGPHPAADPHAAPPAAPAPVPHS